MQLSAGGGGLHDQAGKVQSIHVGGNGGRSKNIRDHTNLLKGEEK